MQTSFWQENGISTSSHEITKDPNPMAITTLIQLSCNKWYSYILNLAQGQMTCRKRKQNLTTQQIVSSYPYNAARIECIQLRIHHIL